MSSSGDEQPTTSKSIETEDTFDEQALNSVPKTSENNKSSGGPIKRLSARSAQYDVDGDGKLDDIEKAMRDMDSKELGHLTNEKVYKILQQQLTTQQELFNMKRFLIVITAFTFLLALSNLGTAFAAARLAKDTQVNSEGLLLTKDGSGKVVAVHVENQVFDVTTSTTAERRQLDLANGDTAVAVTGSLSFADAEALYTRCQNGDPSSIQYSCSDMVDTVQVCGTGVTLPYAIDNRSAPTYRWTYLDQEFTIGPCTAADGVCTVTNRDSSGSCAPIVVDDSGADGSGTGGDFVIGGSHVCMAKNGRKASCLPCNGTDDTDTCHPSEDCGVPDGALCPV